MTPPRLTPAILLVAALAAGCSTTASPAAAPQPTDAGAAPPATAAPTTPDPARVTTTTSAVPEPAPVDTLAPYEPPPLPAVELTAVATPEAEPPAPVKVQLSADPTTRLTGNAPGCASRCITAATLTVAPFGGTADLSVASNVRARFAIWISPSPIEVHDGVPSFAGEAEYERGNPRLGTGWQHTVTGLRADVQYQVILRAKDAAGNKAYLTGSFRTPATAGPGDLAVAGGCAVQCITSGTIAPGPHFPTATLQVATSVDATVRVWIATSAPGTIGGNPVLPAEAEVPVAGGQRRNWNVEVPVHAGSTIHHVVVAATDGNGHTSYRTGQFVSGQEPPTRAVVTIEHVWITGDGDPMDIDKGDFTMLYGLIDEVNLGAARLESTDRKAAAGDDFVPSGATARVVEVVPGGTLPGIGMTIWESDNSPHACVGGTPFVFDPRADEFCNNRANVAYVNMVTIADLDTWPRCTTYGFAGSKEAAACHLIAAPDMGEQWPEFAILVSVEII